MTRLLQSLVSSVAPQPQVELPVQVTPGPVDKVLNWDTSGLKQELSPVSHRSRSPCSYSRDRARRGRRRRRRSPSFCSQSAEFKKRQSRHSKQPRQRSFSRSQERRRKSSSVRYRHHLRHPSPLSSPRRRPPRSPRHSPIRSPRRSSPPRSSPHSPRHSFPLRHSRSARKKSGREKERRDWTPPAERDQKYKRTLSPECSLQSKHDSTPRRKRKMDLSPKRSNKSIRDIINNEEDSRTREKTSRKSPARKKVKDRLGPKPGSITEIFNMEASQGRFLIHSTCYSTNYRENRGRGHHQGVRGQQAGSVGATDLRGRPWVHCPVQCGAGVGG